MEGGLGPAGNYCHTLDILMSAPYVPLAYAACEPGAAVAHASVLHGALYDNLPDALNCIQQVFLQGNALPQRWQGKASFTVCSTSFGPGLSFLALWQAWRADPLRPRRLHVLALEAQPYERQVLAALLQACAPADMQDQVNRLIAQWPLLLPGLHRLEFEGGALTLTLGLGPQSVLAARVAASVDAYFLDGPPPQQQPERWSPAVLGYLFKHAAAGATLAAMSVDPEVCARLQQLGFSLNTSDLPSGAARLTGRYTGRSTTSGVASESGRHAVVIGAGLAGAGAAQALALRGWRVTVLDAAREPEHAGHVAAALTPVVARDDNSRARLSRAGSLRAQARWLGLGPAAAPWCCGTLQLERDAGRAAAMSDTLASLQLPSSWVRAVDRAEASAIAGMPVARGGVFFAGGLMVRPDTLINALLTTPGIEQRSAVQVQRLQAQAGGWLLLDGAGQALAWADTVVVANAVGARGLLERSGLLADLPRIAQMQALAGEITLLPAAALDGGPRCIIGGEGYLLPALEGCCVVGGTYVHDAQQALVSEAGQQTNLGKAGNLLGRDFSAVPAMQAGKLPGWAGWRAVLPGRLPAVGELAHAPGIWLAIGYASRGLSWSALMGDVIAARLCGEPVPLESDLLAAIAPR